MLKLHKAILDGDIDHIIHILFRVNQISKEELNNALQYAFKFKRSRTDIMSLLLDHGADINTQDNDNRTLLMRAILNRDAGTVEYLLLRGANPNIKDVLHWSPLASATCSDKPELVKLLLLYGADMNIKNRIGSTPLMMACQNNRLTEVKLLLQNGADLSTLNENGDTALYFAKKYHHTKIVEYLGKVMLCIVLLSRKKHLKYLQSDVIRKMMEKYL